MKHSDIQKIFFLYKYNFKPELSIIKKITNITSYILVIENTWYNINMLNCKKYENYFLKKGTYKIYKCFYKRIIIYIRQGVESGSS